MTSLHRHETASLGLRATRLTGEGKEHGRLVRLILLSYTRWPGQPKQDPLPCNATLASRAGLSENEVERAMARLRAAGIITTRWGKRPGYKPGRLIALDLHAPCKALAPEGFDVRNLWAICRSIRARPAALVTMMLGAYMLASDAAGGRIEDRAEIGCTASALRRFIGQADNSSWTKRLRELEALGLIRREGRRVEVSSPRVWFELAVEVAERAQPGLRAPVVREAASRVRPDPAWDLVEPDPSLWVEVFEHDSSERVHVAQAPDRRVPLALVAEAQPGDPHEWLSLSPPQRLARVESRTRQAYAHPEEHELERAAGER